MRFTPLSVVVTLFAALPISSAAVAASPKYEVAAVSDGGTIKGTVVYRGDIPTRTVLPTKDKETCGGIRKDPLVTVGPGGEVKDAVVFLKEIPKGKDWPKLPGKPKIDNVKCVFEPRVQVAHVGPVDIVNSDPVLHNTHGYYGKDTAFNVALPLQGGRVSKVLRRPGVVRVDCDAHGWMEGWVFVAPNPYYSLTSADGAFSIGNVPPGKYVLSIWQEHVGTVEMPVSVKAKETVQVPIELKM